MSHPYHSYIGTAKFQAPSAGQPKSDAAFVWSCCNCTCFKSGEQTPKTLKHWIFERSPGPQLLNTPGEESENHLGRLWMQNDGEITRYVVWFLGCPLGTVKEPFQASSKMDGVTLESFITWSTPSHHIPRFHPVEPPAFQKCNNASTFITLAFLTPNECQCVSQGVPLVLSTSHFRPHRKWMAWHLSPSSHEAHLHITYHASTR